MDFGNGFRNATQRLTLSICSLETLFHIFRNHHQLLWCSILGPTKMLDKLYHGLRLDLITGHSCEDKMETGICH